MYSICRGMLKHLHAKSFVGDQEVSFPFSPGSITAIQQDGLTTSPPCTLICYEHTYDAHDIA